MLNSGENNICKNCKHVSVVNPYSESIKYKCFSPHNKMGVDVVSGNTLYRYSDCYDARRGEPEPFNPTSCGTIGAWYEDKPASPITPSVTIADTDAATLAKVKLAEIKSKRASATDLLESLGGM